MIQYNSQNELEITREEKKKAEEKLREMEEEHKYQREMEKRELERRAQVRKDRKGHNSVKKEELSVLTESFSWKLEVLLINLEYTYCQK